MEHQNTPIGKKGFECLICQRRFTKKCGLALHHRMVHKAVAECESTAATSDVEVATETNSTPEVFKTPDHLPPGKQRCVDCGGFYVNLLNHRSCSKKLRKLGTEYDSDTSTTSAMSSDVESDESVRGSSSASPRKIGARRRISRRRKQHILGQQRVVESLITSGS
jgi:hypothetical protein